DVTLHLRIPAPGLMPEMHAGVEQLFHGDDGHGRTRTSSGRPTAARWAWSVVATDPRDPRPWSRTVTRTHHADRYTANTEGPPGKRAPRWCRPGTPAGYRIDRARTGREVSRW